MSSASVLWHCPCMCVSIVYGLGFKTPGVFGGDGIANAANDPIKIGVIAPFNPPPGEGLYGSVVTRRLRAIGIRDKPPHQPRPGRTALPNG